MRSETNGNSNKIIIGILIVAIIGSWVYFNYSMNSTKAELTIESDTKIATIDSAKKVLQLQFDAASIKVDSLTAANTEMSSDLQNKTIEIGKLKSNISENDLINALHPTSAVCGMPLEAARNFILESEKYNRKYYSGFLGEYKMQEQTNLFVNLRCCEIESQKTILYVGCGITKDSQTDKEFIETENKAKTILSVLRY